jgi:hypothetical protein
MVPLPPSASGDDGFPSGPWTGFYLQFGRRNRMDLSLEFAGGSVSGQGSDDIGRFAVRGTYDVESREVRWSKTYVAGDRVHYRGFGEVRGIWGTWVLGGLTGGFHVWPLGAGEGAVVAAEAETLEPAEALR